MNRHYSTMMIAAGVALVCGAIVLLSRIVLLDTIAAVPLIFILPGYALQNALFVRTSSDPIERVTLSVALSLITAVLGAFLLDASPSKLTLFSWTVLLVGITLLGSAVASLRRINGLSNLLLQGEGLNHMPFVFAPADLIKFSVALVMVGVAVYIALTSASTSLATTHFTQLWMLPTPENHSIQVGVSNQESETESYVLEIRDSHTVLTDITIINLGNQMQWTYTYTLPASQALPVEALLYRWTTPNVVYRRTTLNSW